MHPLDRRQCSFDAGHAVAAAHTVDLHRDGTHCSLRGLGTSWQVAIPPSPMNPTQAVKFPRPVEVVPRLASPREPSRRQRRAWAVEVLRYSMLMRACRTRPHLLCARSTADAFARLSWRSSRLDRLAHGISSCRCPLATRDPKLDCRLSSDNWGWRFMAGKPQSYGLSSDAVIPEREFACSMRSPSCNVLEPYAS